MKALFLLLELLTDSDAIRSVLQSCFTAAVFSVVVLFLWGVLTRCFVARVGDSISPDSRA